MTTIHQVPCSRMPSKCKFMSILLLGTHFGHKTIKSNNAHTKYPTISHNEQNKQAQKITTELIELQPIEDLQHGLCSMWKIKYQACGSIDLWEPKSA